MAKNRKVLKYGIIFLLLIVINLILVEKVKATVVIINATDSGNYKDGHVRYTGAAYATFTAATTMWAGDDTNPFYYRAFIDFNISIIPTGVTINNVVLNLTLQTDDGSNNNIYGLNATSLNFTAQDLYNACGGGAGATTYLTNDASWNNAGVNIPTSVDLGADAITNITNKLVNHSFGICIQSTDESDTNPQKFYTANQSTDQSRASIPQLIITYTIAASNTDPYNITLNYPTNNSQVNNTNSINFNFSFLDRENQSLNCSLIFDSVINATNITSIEGNHSNYTLTGITYGMHNWSVNCSDYELYNNSETFFFSVNDTSAPNYLGNSTNNTAARLNEDIQIYINLSDNNQLSFFKFEWNGSGAMNNNTNGTIDQKTYNITLNLSINLSYGSVIAWKFYFNDSSKLWNETPRHYITVANTNPVINEILCYNLTKAINCSALTYRNNLTAIRVNCTDADNQIVNVTFNLTNVNDTKSLIYSNATTNDTILFNYSYNQLINDSGLFNLTITCHDRANTTSNSTSWYIEFGYLKTNLTITFNNIDYTTGNVNVRQHDWFKAVLNITCSNGECGTINASLDPATAAPAAHKPSIYAQIAAYFTLFVFLLIIVFVPILIIEDKKLTRKEDLILLAAIIGVVLVYLALHALDRLI